MCGLLYGFLMKHFFGRVLEQLVFLTKNFKVGKCRKAKKKLKARKSKTLVSDRQNIYLLKFVSLFIHISSVNVNRTKSGTRIRF